ncbi:hypothetical protein JTE90_017168 [Oedothorax gibbosus]|uniref:Uncharacterized protein n=1 Tax=Oedothorax gibbosus TaxID=931172 RepID=A0AAV6TF45_9ARAC|nr:hypothetical protein JTE90_017168 [Oedothorax gibbosus]
MEPFSASSSKGSHLRFSTTTRSAPVAAPGGLTPGTFNARHRDPPTHCGVNLHEELCRAARYRPNAGASPFSGLVCFGRLEPASFYQINQTNHPRSKSGHAPLPPNQKELLICQILAVAWPGRVCCVESNLEPQAPFWW